MDIDYLKKLLADAVIGKSGLRLKVVEGSSCGTLMEDERMAIGVCNGRIFAVSQFAYGYGGWSEEKSVFHLLSDEQLRLRVDRTFYENCMDELVSEIETIRKILDGSKQ